VIHQQAHFLADSAQVNPDGTFSVQRAGITDISAQSWPALARLTLITRIVMDVEDAAHLHQMSFRIWHETEGELTAWRQPVAAKVVDVNRPISLNVVGNLEFRVPGPGKIGIETTIDDMRLPMLLVFAQTQQLPPPRPRRRERRSRR
jgi:hypothetical protein